MYKQATRTIVLALLLASPAAITQELLKTDKSWDGGEFYYPEGKPEVTSVILSLAEHQVTQFHCHPVPTLGYILSGTVQVETRDGAKGLLHAGESVVEVMRTVHRGIAVGGPAQILVFYAGARDVPTTVLPEQDADGQYCDQ